MQTQSKIGLSVVEAGWLLQKTEGQIRGMLRRGDLTYVVEGRKIDPANVRSNLDGPYACLLLDPLLAGVFEVPRPERRYGPPTPLYPGDPRLMLLAASFAPRTQWSDRWRS